MTKQKNELEEQIVALKSELEASILREELALNSTKGANSLKARIKRTKFGQKLMDPSSKTGKIFRLPRTIFRIACNPSIIKEIRQQKTEKNIRDDFAGEDEKDQVFSPVKFFVSDTKEKRVNLIIGKISEEMVKSAVLLANNNNCGLRIITCAEHIEPLKYKQIIKRLDLEEPVNVEFYSSYEQEKKKNIFELEVGKQDIFISTIKGSINSET